ncbi:MAG: metallophosphatase domain-containing protein [Deltaproteobacteria bacterium]|nr:metallophosphatase domain-containing protein [Deltaproteobacteria bacterium]
MRVVCISDTHLRHGALTVPDGDVLVHAGDLLGHGLVDEVEEVDLWLAALPHRHKIVIAGNHDWCFEKAPAEAEAALRSATYLRDAGVVIDGVRFWGSPWQPEFLAWAFNLPRGEPLAERWRLIPDDTDVLVTHGPPSGHGDRCFDGRRVGCEALLAAVRDRVRPRLHVFGHIHEGYGVTREGGTTFVNASACDLDYRPVQPPIVIDL